MFANSSPKNPTNYLSDSLESCFIFYIVFSLETICELHTRIIAELESLAAEERGALCRSLGIERVEEVDAQIVDGDIARTERKAPDAVDVAVG